VAEAEQGAGRVAGLDTSVAHPARVYDYWLPAWAHTATPSGQPDEWAHAGVADGLYAIAKAINRLADTLGAGNQ